MRSRFRITPNPKITEKITNPQAYRARKAAPKRINSIKSRTTKGNLTVAFGDRNNPHTIAVIIGSPKPSTNFIKIEASAWKPQYPNENNKMSSNRNLTPRLMDLGTLPLPFQPYSVSAIISYLDNHTLSVYSFIKTISIKPTRGWITVVWTSGAFVINEIPVARLPHFKDS